MSWNNFWPGTWPDLAAALGELPGWAKLTLAGAAVLVVIAVVWSAVRSARRFVRSKDGNAKASIGFAVVQTGVSFIVITGVYEWFRKVLDMPLIEAFVLAIFIEAATWAAVGFIYAHGRKSTETTDGSIERTSGFGEAGPFFWFAVAGGGILAILGSDTVPVGIGRTIVVGIGAYMWYLRLLQATQRPGTPSRWRWTPKRLLLAIGAIEPADEDITDVAREWQVRRTTRAIRWANSAQPWQYLGKRALVKAAEQADETVLGEAQRRYAAGHVLRAQTATDSAVMRALLATVEQSMTVRPLPEPRREELAVESAAAAAMVEPIALPVAPERTETEQADRASVRELKTEQAEQTDRAEQVVPTGQVYAADRGPSGQITARVPDTGKRTDEQILSAHGEQLARILSTTGKLSRYAVEQACSVSGRQADRIAGTIKARAEQA